MQAHGFPRFLLAEPDRGTDNLIGCCHISSDELLIRNGKISQLSLAQSVKHIYRIINTGRIQVCLMTNAI
jgi:hypothetical protein